MAKMYPGMNSSEQESGIPNEGSCLPSSSGRSLDKAGISNKGYLDKKGTPSGLNAMFNDLPPGMNIEDQKLTDQHDLSLKTYSGGLSFPGDGWT